MSHPSLRTHGAPLAAAALALAGCNAIFGLGEVDERGSGGAGGTGGTLNTGAAGGTGGTGGAAPLCADPEVPGNLIVNGSFEKEGGWSPPSSSDHGTLDFVPAEDCDLACGDRVARLSGEAAQGQYLTLGFSQMIARKIELGGTLHLGARYRFEAPFAPYFSLTANGYPAGAPTLKGNQQGDHLVIDDLAVDITDPRRTEDHVEIMWTHSIQGAKAVSWLDCVSLTYDPPPGTELLQNGWFEGLLQGWEALGAATLAATDLTGLCGNIGGVVTVPAGEDGDAIRSTKTGSWPAGTTFRFGGAAGSLKFDGPKIPPFSIVLRLDYEADADPGTPEFAETTAPASDTSETWQMATGALAAERAVTSVSIRLVVDNSGSPSAAATLSADCFTVRAIP